MLHIYDNEMSVKSSLSSSNAPFTKPLWGVWTCVLLPLVHLECPALWLLADVLLDLVFECFLLPDLWEELPELAVNSEYVAIVSCSSWAVLVSPALTVLSMLLLLLLVTMYCSLKSSQSILMLWAVASLPTDVEALLILRLKCVLRLSILFWLRLLPRLQHDWLVIQGFYCISCILLQ